MRESAAGPLARERPPAYRPQRIDVTVTAPSGCLPHPGSEPVQDPFENFLPLLQGIPHRPGIGPCDFQEEGRAVRFEDFPEKLRFGFRKPQVHDSTSPFMGRIRPPAGFSPVAASASIVLSFGGI